MLFFYSFSIVYILVACMNVPGCEGTLDFCVQMNGFMFVDY